MKVLLAAATVGIAIFGLFNWWATNSLIKAFSAMASSGGADPAEWGYALTEFFPAVQKAAMASVAAACALVITSVVVMTRGDISNQKTTIVKKMGVVFLGLCSGGLLLSQLGRGNTALESIPANMGANGINPEHVGQLISRFLLLSSASWGFLIIFGILAFLMAITTRSTSSPKS